MSDNYAVVMTTINHPTPAVVNIARDTTRLDADFIVIGDSKSPPDFDQPNCLYFDIKSQLASGFAYATAVPERHYARKNIGYLIAMRRGANIIIETDDDNIPRDEFWSPRNSYVPAKALDDDGWINVYSYFSDSRIWPRGLPLNEVLTSPPSIKDKQPSLVHCPIQQGLADENPDVDAIYRLVLPLPISFRREDSIALSRGWCPFNSQNTTWFSCAFPLLYLPFHCSFRMTDIWRSFVAQRIAYLNGWHILFHNSTVYQERNEHDLMRDFEEEIPGYLNNQKIKNQLENLTLDPGVDEIPKAMKACYQKLVELKFVGVGELALLELWLDDIGKIGAPK